ncbi:MAG: DNA internalization-related competence protein ComEC/Rec2 [Chromatiales bacterium]
MRSGTTAFFLGVLGAQLLATLPDARLCWLLPLILLLAGRVPVLRLPLLAVAGALWAIWRAHHILADVLPPGLEGTTITVQGKVIGLPEAFPGRVRFNFATEALTRDGREWAGCGRVRLDWRGEQVPLVHTGELWRLEVRLKQPHGFRNPGSFDYEGWLFQHRIRATGYVVAEGEHARLAEAGWSVDAWREHIRQNLNDAIGGHSLAGVVAALAIGARDGITQEQWRVFFRTNTGHLIAISGLHIGLLAGAGFFAGRWLWSRWPRALLWVAAPRVAAASASMAALLYSALAGFEVPAQRTLIMIGVVMLGLWSNRRYSALDSLLLALTLVLIIDPIAVVSVGFWLSFLAVAILLYSTGGALREQGLWWRLGRAHIAMAVGLAPVLAFLFGQNPIVGPVGNLVAVPWVSFVVVPLVLVGTFLLPLLPALGHWLLQAALLALDLLWAMLAPLAELDFASLPVAHPGWISLGCATVGAALLLIPRGLPGRAIGIVWMLPLALHSPPRPQVGELWLTVLDVGQGLAAVVRTRDHALVFDTGPSYSNRFDTGTAVIAPYLRHEGIDQVDLLIVSHDDNDHIGGVRSLLAQVPVQAVRSSVPARIDHPRAFACAEGQSWEWDGVGFMILNPPSSGASSDNNASCVLQARAPGGAVLLPGDIEAAVEHRLVREHGAALRADILVVPHHGSKSSSTPAFIDAVAPRYAVHPVGYRNRFRFPNKGVVSRYDEAGAISLRSDAHGAVSFHIGNGVGEPILHRLQHQRYWHQR